MNALRCLEPPASAVAEQVRAEEYARLLLLPRRKLMEEDLAHRARAARAFYAAQGRPWIAARRVEIAGIDKDSVRVVEGPVFESASLAERLRAGEAHALVAIAVTAGAQAEVESRRLWRDDRPDEGFFVERFAAAVAEQLVRLAAAWVCRSSEPRAETALFQASPGCSGWPMEDQQKLMALLAGGAVTLGPIRMLPSGMLSPGASLLAVLGLTRRPAAPTPADACRECDLTPCAFRRAKYAGNGTAYIGMRRASYTGMRRASFRARRDQGWPLGMNPRGHHGGNASLRAPKARTNQ